MNDALTSLRRFRPEARLGAIGVLARDGRYLMIKRAAQVIKGGTWCFPGGHVEPGESSADGVRRELAEELGIEVEPVCHLGSLEVRDTGHVLDVWVVNHAGDEFQPDAREIADLRWVTPAEIRCIAPTLPSNLTVAEMLGH